ncbi:SAM-dependent methyltransferase [Frankia sp. AgB1.8]|nr:SAM-dependent methyltransferase [Frankia sp. AgB1.8]
MVKVHRSHEFLERPDVESVPGVAMRREKHESLRRRREDALDQTGVLARRLEAGVVQNLPGDRPEFVGAEKRSGPVARLAADLELVEPGIVLAHRWRSDIDLDLYPGTAVSFTP